MEANDTVMSKELQVVYGCILPQHIAGLNGQAEISFKAGMKKVVDWVNSDLVTIAVEIPASLPEGKSLIEVGRDIMHLQTNGYKSAEKWQVKLKEWEIEKVAAAERTSTEKQIFAVLKDQADICMRVCPCWDKQGNFCFATLPSECTKLNNILALIER